MFSEIFTNFETDVEDVGARLLQNLKVSDFQKSDIYVNKIIRNDSGFRVELFGDIWPLQKWKILVWGVINGHVRQVRQP